MSRPQTRLLSSNSPDDLSASTIRRLKNFVNNFTVVGGTIRFDGKTPVLRIPKRVVVMNQNQWELYQEDAVASPLGVSMRPGVLVNTNSTSLYPQNTVKTWTTANVTESQTTIFWLKVTVAKSTYQTYFEVWHVTGSVVETGTTLPEDTLDIPGDTGGDLHFQIGTVTADGSAVTSITQDLSTSVTVVFPLGVIIEEFTCP